MKLIRTIAFVLFVFIYASCEKDEIEAGADIKFDLVRCAAGVQVRNSLQ
jgi:hypothetical protein